MVVAVDNIWGGNVEAMSAVMGDDVELCATALRHGRADGCRPWWVGESAGRVKVKSLAM